MSIVILLIPKHSLKYNSPPIFPVDKFEKIEGVKGRPFSDGFMETFFFIKDRDPPLKASRIVKMGFCLFLYVILTALKFKKKMFFETSLSIW